MSRHRILASPRNRLGVLVAVLLAVLAGGLATAATTVTTTSNLCASSTGAVRYAANASCNTGEVAVTVPAASPSAPAYTSGVANFAFTPSGGTATTLQVLAYDWAVTNSTTLTGSTGGGAGKAAIGALTFSTPLGPNGPIDLLRQLYKGLHTTGTLTVTQGSTAVASIALTSFVVSGWSLQTTGETSRPYTVSITLNALSATVTPGTSSTWGPSGPHVLLPVAPNRVFVGWLNVAGVDATAPGHQIYGLAFGATAPAPTTAGGAAGKATITDVTGTSGLDKTLAAESTLALNGTRVSTWTGLVGPNATPVLTLTGTNSVVGGVHETSSGLSGDIPLDALSLRPQKLCAKSGTDQVCLDVSTYVIS